MAGRLSVFAGSGALVPHAVAAAEARGYKVQVLALTPRPDLKGVKVVGADLANPLGILWSLKTFRTSHIVMAGGITLSDKTREALLRFARKESGVGEDGPVQPLGDAGMSGLGVALRKLTGATLIGIHELAPDLVAGEGTLAGPELDSEGLGSARFALSIAREIGRLDVGQAAVTAGRHVIAVEDVAGTDALLARVEAYAARGLAGGAGAPMVLAKACKPQQPLFVDLPAIGPDTVANAARAGIAVIAIEAGRTLLIERQGLCAAAEKARISLVGLQPGNG